MADLYIIAAGNGTRMGSPVPKALIPIAGEPNITNTLKRIGSQFENVFLVTNNTIQSIWLDFLEGLDPSLKKNLINVPIDSGLGDGHAVREALSAQVSVSRNNESVICWGDAFFSDFEIIDELMSQFISSVNTGVVPVVRKATPYVTTLTNNNLSIQSADFSKYGESHSAGFHDQSIFRFRTESLQRALDSLHASLWKNGRYMTQGGELSLLFTFHYLSNIGMPLKAYETNYPTSSFNTPEELALIRKQSD